MKSLDEQIQNLKSSADDFLREVSESPGSRGSTDTYAKFALSSGPVSISTLLQSIQARDADLIDTLKSIAQDGEYVHDRAKDVLKAWGLYK